LEYPNERKIINALAPRGRFNPAKCGEGHWKDKPRWRWCLIGRWAAAGGKRPRIGSGLHFSG